jgi:hypothetical protein
VSPQSTPVSPASGTTIFSVASNIDWLVSENSEWLEAIKTDANSLMVIYSENENIYSRSAEIYIHGAGVDSQSVSIIQEGAIPSAVSHSSESRQIYVFPNPVTDKAKLTYQKGTVETIEIYEISGRLVISLQNPDKAGETEIDFSGFNPGLYVYRLIDKEGNPDIGMILKK